MFSKSSIPWILLVAIIVVVMLACNTSLKKSSAGSGEVAEGAARYVNGAEAFKAEVTDYDGVVLVDFGAHWCPPCRALAPSLDRLATEMGDEIKVIKVYDEDQGIKNDSILRTYGIGSFPTLMIFKNGKKIKSSVGGRSYNELHDWVTGVMNELDTLD